VQVAVMYITLQMSILGLILVPLKLELLSKAFRFAVIGNFNMLHIVALINLRSVSNCGTDEPLYTVSAIAYFGTDELFDLQIIVNHKKTYLG